MKAKVGSTRNTRMSLLSSTSRMRPGLPFRPSAATPSSRAHSSISLRLQKNKGQAPLISERDANFNE